MSVKFKLFISYIIKPNFFEALVNFWHDVGRHIQTKITAFVVVTMKATSLRRKQHMFMQVVVFYLCVNGNSKYSHFPLKTIRSMSFYRVYTAYCDDGFYFSRSVLIYIFYTLFVFHNVIIFHGKRRKYRL